MNEKTKRKQKPKAGKVIRLRKKTWEVVEKKIRKNETIDDTICRLAGLLNTEGTRTSPHFYILPESGIVLKGCRTMAQARGAAVLLAVKQKQDEPETPIQVRAVSA